MEFKIIVSSRHTGPVDRYIMDLKNIDRVCPGGCEMHILRTTSGADIIFHADGYDPELYNEVHRHAHYILNTVKVPAGAHVVGVV